MTRQPQLTEQDYRALCHSLDKWYREAPAEREQQFQWRFLGAFCHDPDEWTRLHDPQQYIVRFLTHDLPDDLEVLFYMRALANGDGEFTVQATLVDV